jgi:hypothetical protein
MSQEVYILSPVRQVTDEQAVVIATHVQKVKDEGDIVFNPIQNAPQDDPTGYHIVITELASLYGSSKRGGRVDMLWNLGGKPSEGSRVDLGIAYALSLECRLVAEFNKENPAGPQIAHRIITGDCEMVEKLQKKLVDMRQRNGATIDWDTVMVNDRQEWQRLNLGLALGCLAHDPIFKISMGELWGYDYPDQKSYPKVIREIEARQL